MAWARIDDAVLDHPKFATLTDAAWRLWASALVYANKHRTDGFIPANIVERLGVRGSAKRALAELTTPCRDGAAPLWEVVPHGYQVHDFLDNNLTREQIEQRRNAGRLGGSARRSLSTPSSGDEAEMLSGSAKQSAKRPAKQNGSNIPSPPIPSPTPTVSADADRAPREEGKAEKTDPERKPGVVAVAAYVDRYRLAFGEDPNIDGRSARTLKSLITRFGPETVLAALDAFFKDPYARTRAYDVVLFEQQFNKFRPHGQEPHEAVPEYMLPAVLPGREA